MRTRGLYEGKEGRLPMEGSGEWRQELEWRIWEAMSI